MDFRESETIEIKSIVTDGIKKEVVAFANSEGGTLYVGVADDGTVLGVDDGDKRIRQMAGMIRDSIKPDVTMFVHFETIACDEKNIVAVEVQRGTNRPYYLAKNGLCPKGVFVRRGTLSFPASDIAIRSMIKETDGDSYESMRSLFQSLSFHDAKDEFSNRQVGFGEKPMQTLGLVSSDGLFTNLGLLLSDQCPFTMKIAVFENSLGTVFLDRREFSGSLFRQLNETFEYINLNNCTHATFDKLLRLDKKDYPDVAVREALLNSMVHRDYTYYASTLCNIYPDRIEFVSIGGLLPGIVLDDVLLGLSVCRNPKLANVFYRLRLIEAYGTGLRKILASYAGASVKPEFLATGNAFKVMLPNCNAMQVASPEVLPSSHEAEERAVLDYLRNHKAIGRKDAEKLIGQGQTAAGRVLKGLVDKGLLVKVGSGRITKYAVQSSAGNDI